MSWKMSLGNKLRFFKGKNCHNSVILKNILLLQIKIDSMQRQIMEES